VGQNAGMQSFYILHDKNQLNEYNHPVFSDILSVARFFVKN